MKHRIWWLGSLGLVLLIGILVVLRPKSTDDSKGQDQNSGNNSAGTGSVARTPKLAHPPTTTSLVTRVAENAKLPELSDEMVTRILGNRTNPESLLAVSRLTGALELLREAAKSFPDHAMIQLELALRGKTPEEKQQALESFRRLEPGNAMGDYLSALSHFEQGQAEDALADLKAVEAHPGFGDRNSGQIQSAEDVFVAAGYGRLEAKSAALLGQPKTQTMTLNELSRKLFELYQEDTRAEDAEAAQAVLQMGLALSRRLRAEARLIVDDKVGISMETRFLKQLPVDAPVPGSTLTAAIRLNELTTENQEISELAKQSSTFLNAMKENEVLAYLERLNQDGELKALRWLEQNHK